LAKPCAVKHVWQDGHCIVTELCWSACVDAGLERKKDRAMRRKNVASAAGGSELEMLDDSQDDDILESVIKSVTSPSSRQTRDRRRARTGTRTSRN